MQQQGGSPYGVPPPPDMSTLFSSPPPLSDAAAAAQQQQKMVSSAAAAESASPISTRPPPQPQQQQQYSAAAVPNYEELGAADDSLCPEEGAGGPGGASGSGGNRWPRQETLALLKIRSDMDAVFRDATLKGPLWEEVSRKLGELGYRRSAKKCKEKFENVHKYYKRTKEGRAGRQDGKSYRFFSQLEALHSTTAVAANSVFMDAATNASSAAPTQPVAAAAAAAVARFPNPQQVSAPTPIATAPPPHLPPMPMPMLVHENTGIGAAATAAGLSFSSNTSSDASETDGDEEEDDDEATEEGPSSGKKRKREASGGGGRKMMAFFEGMMRQVMERQEAMQQRFLEVIEKREQDRAIREEAWRRQEMARIDREHEVAAGERAAAAARDAAVISFLQKVTGQTLPVPQQTTTTSAALPPAPIHIPAPEPAPAPATLSIVQTPPLPPTRPQPQQQQQLTPPPSQRQPQPPPPSPQQENTEMLHQQYHQSQQHTPSLALPQPPPPPMCPTSSELVPILSEPPQDGGANVSVILDPSSSRWPKTEVHALINLRSGLDSRYQESGPKGPLWEEISAGMKRLGYNRSAKRCKEKWENINKYFKKVKEGNKKRPEDAKTCPYFHQLDALYRSKHLSGVPGSSQGLAPEQDSTHRNPTNPQPISVMPPASQQQQQLNQGQTDTKKGNGGITDAGAGGPSNCRMPTTLHSGNGDNNSDSGTMKKPEDIVRELMSQPNDDDYSDNMDEDDEEDDEEEDEDGGKSQYTIQFQRPNVGGGNGTGSSSAATGPSGGGKAPGSSFLAMVR
ncbi:putative trihelix transcription factor GTL1 isoform X1 [Iris pallida]|uniref:Trihelix transcription factor GTL1 isoform X1 n=1 Tax=Iris pallida TaxID=29817 RepID=A0AAX6ICE5_IRIPA|nr:putative trihelix transcription factor GTL1 isoform X1 [Iris pallida]